MWPQRDREGLKPRKRFLKDCRNGCDLTQGGCDLTNVEWFLGEINEGSVSSSEFTGTLMVIETKGAETKPVRFDIYIKNRKMRKTENWICKIFIFLFKKSSCRQLCQALWGSQAAASFLARAVVGLFPGHLHRWQVLGTGTLTAVCRPSRAYGLATHITHPGGQMGFMDWGGTDLSATWKIYHYIISIIILTATHTYIFL